MHEEARWSLAPTSLLTMRRRCRIQLLQSRVGSTLLLRVRADWEELWVVSVIGVGTMEVLGMNVCSAHVDAEPEHPVVVRGLEFPFELRTARSISHRNRILTPSFRQRQRLEPEGADRMQPPSADEQEDELRWSGVRAGNARIRT